MDANRIQSFRRRALLVGINRYPHFRNKDLKGCVTDARELGAVLRERFGFAAADVRLLLDEEATREGILGGLADLAAEAASDDVIFFFYAGHGWHVPRQGGGERQTLVPVDSGSWKGPNRDILDVEIGAWLRAVTGRTANVTVIFDCCHSGNGTRGLADYCDAVRSLALSEEAPPDGAMDPAEPPVDLLAPGDRYVALGACREDEEAWEYTSPQGTKHGAFSFFLLRELVAAEPGSSCREIFQRAAAEVRRIRRQHPRGEGALDRLLFGGAVAPRGRHVTVREIRQELLTLEVGAVHGAVVGSEWEISSPGAAQRVRARIESVGATTSQARQLGDARAQLPARAEEVRRPAGHRAPVEIRDAALRERCAARLDTSLWLRPVAPGGPAELCVAADGGAWIVMGTDGVEILRHERDVGFERLCADLERRVRFERVRLLANPRSLRRDQVAVTPLRQAAGRWVVVERTADGAYELRPGEVIGLRIENRSVQDLYVAVIDLGLEWTITQVYPPSGAMMELIAEGAVQQVGAWRVVVPDGCALPGREYLQVVSTSEQTDLHPLYQEIADRDGPGSSPLVGEEWAAELIEVRVLPRS